MQPELNDLSPVNTNLTTPQTPPTSSQHGSPLDRPDLRSTDQQSLPIDERVEGTDTTSESDRSPTDQRGGFPSLTRQLEGLNVADGSTATAKPKYYQISDYENASSPSPPRKNSDGPAFKVIKRKGHNVASVQLDEFPNG